MDPSRDPLLQPFQLRHLTLRNRLMSTAHEPALGEGGMPTDRYRLYHLEKAKGGIALTMTAGSACVSADSGEPFGNLLAWKDEIVPWLRRLTDDCHEAGSAVMIQLTHLGRRAGAHTAAWLPVLAPSRLREAAHPGFPKEMEDWDIARVVADYAAAAQRMQAAGLDGIELEAYGHLLDQFWSPLTNRREDEYGGSLDNRMRFSQAVLEAIRRAVGPDFIVGLRLVADEATEHGIDRAEGLEICRRFQASGMVDFLNIIRGRIASWPELTDVIPLMGARSNPALDFAGAVRAETGAVVFHAARIADVATARHAIATGKLDMVGMTRPHIAEPHIVRKIREGREHEIRPCVGATYCMETPGGTACIHNAATGREADLPQIVPRSTGPTRKVVVVGAGPAGLEAARVAAERGHKVVVLEAAEKAGGQVLLAARGPRRRELVGIVDWRLAELARLGAEVRLGTYAEVEDVLAEAPDVVLIATGGTPDLGFVSGGELALSTWDILAGTAKPTGRVLVFDDHGGYEAAQAAEILALAGAEVEYMTPEHRPSIEIGHMNYVNFARAFQQAGVRITINTRVAGIARDGNALAVRLASDYTELNESRQVDHVVLEHGTVPNDALYFALKPLSLNLGAVDYDALLGGRAQTGISNPAGRFRLMRIGDAVASRSIHAAIHDGLRFAKDL